MNKKKLFILLAIVIVIAVPFSAFAATSNTAVAKSVRGFLGFDTSKLTDAQKSDIKDYSTKMANLQKEFINKMVANGSMTKEQGDAALKKIDDMLANGNVNAFNFGMGKGGFGEKGVPGKNAIDTSKLTDAQKADLKETYKKMADAQKANIAKMVANNLITKDQGDAETKAVDALLSKVSANDLFIGRGGFGVFGSFGKMRIDTSKLTDQQKADLTSASKIMADLQKELITKMVADNLLTKDQGDAAAKKIDAMQSAGLSNGFPKEFGMRRGHPGSMGNQKIPNADGTSTPKTKKFF